MAFVDRISRTEEMNAQNAQDKIVDLFIAVVEEQGREGNFAQSQKLVAALKRKVEISSSEDLSREERGNAYNKLFDDLGYAQSPEIKEEVKGEERGAVKKEYSEDQLKFMELIAKMNDLCRRVRKIATSHTVQDVDRARRQTAEHMDYALEICHERGTSSEDVQASLDSNGKAWFSITAHPTNPTTVAYTKAGGELDSVLDNPDSISEDLMVALRKIHETEIASLDNKTPIEELEEALPNLDMIYRTSVGVRDNLEDSLRRRGYKGVGTYLPVLEAMLKDSDGSEPETKGEFTMPLNDEQKEAVRKIIADIQKQVIYDESVRSTAIITTEQLVNRLSIYVGLNEKQIEAFLQDPKKREDVVIRKNLIEPCLWVLGDGDGNPNQTPENLAEGIGILRAKIKSKYIDDLDAIIALQDPLLMIDKNDPNNPDASSTKILKEIRKNLLEDKYKTPEDLKADLIKLQDAIPSTIKMVDDLIYRVDTFGFHFAKIDVRHKAEDIMTTVARLAAKTGLLEEAGFKDEEDFKSSDLQKIERLLRENGQKKLANEINDIDEKLADSEYGTKDDLIAALNKVVESMGENIAIKPQVSQMVAELVDIINKQGLSFKDKSAEKQQEAFSDWLADGNILEKFKDVKIEELIDNENDSSGKTARRIFGRLRVIGENHDMSDKLVVAENKGAHHALAALFALKASGNVVGGEGAKIDLVTLSESVSDLGKIRETQLSMLSDKTYRAHVAARGRIVAQIAKSDTVRRAGRGAEDSQDDAVRKLYSLSADIMEKYEKELGHTKICIFQGGGAALQRGGGKVSELAHKCGIAARQVIDDLGFPKEHMGEMFGPVTLTVQGHQKGILFQPELTATLLMCSLIAQGFHAKNRVAENLSEKHALDPEQRAEARQNREKACEKMRGAYLENIYSAAVNRVFKKGTWLAGKIGNRSSRASKRGGDSASAAGQTPNDIIPESAKEILKQRAIGTERLGAHTMTQLLSMLNLNEGLEYLAGKEALHSTYKGNKSERDSQRNNAMVLAMLNYNISWDMMIGEERPDDIEEINRLSDIFKEKYQGKNEEELTALGEDQQEINKCTLAWLEMEAWKTARLNHISILGVDPVTGKSGDPQSDNYDPEYTERFAVEDIDGLIAAIKDETFTLTTPIENSWPELATHIEGRERQLECAHYMESIFTRQCNEHPDQAFSDNEKMMILLGYIASDFTNAPVGAATTVTSKRKHTNYKGDEPHDLKKGASSDSLESKDSSASSDLQTTTMPMMPALMAAHNKHCGSAIMVGG